MKPHPLLCSRRDFLATTLNAVCGAGALCAVPPVRLAAADATARGSKVRFGFTSYQWGKDWDIPTTIANLQRAQVFGVELRTSASYAHGVELSLNAQQRQEVRKRFADSPVALVGLASAERLDWPEPENPGKVAGRNYSGYSREMSRLLTGLEAGKAWHYRVVARDPAGNESASADGVVKLPRSPAAKK